MAVAIEPLRGKALLSKLKEIPTLSKSEKAKACGYVTRAKDKERANLSEFIEAILEAQGLTVEPEQTGGRGRTPTYRVSVHANGQIVIGKAYTEMMGLKPGDEFEIKLGYKHIKLVQIQAEGDLTNTEV
ncbi:AbrB family transcriptional regulator [Leptolyngbya sp. FACHB-711]|uniref:AbrB family transcriptional regulator n=1 Tax=unclassified Leptolyngbya TaxID=2650499 RepID=UPI00168867AF|nr:AbrB family transcriptional regulator [Leptolyngbya sp. FACHB-711]MBD2025693.1 AbrB family transcriptional regulator [Leptolyngbya sp. FACHB-711]